MTHDDDDDDDDEDQDSDHDDSAGDHDDSDGDKNGASANIGRLVSVRRGRFNKFWLAPILFEILFIFSLGRKTKKVFFFLKKGSLSGTYLCLVCSFGFSKHVLHMVCVLFCPYKTAKISLKRVLF